MTFVRLSVFISWCELFETDYLEFYVFCLAASFIVFMFAIYDSIGLVIFLSKLYICEIWYLNYHGINMCY